MLTFEQKKAVLAAVKVAVQSTINVNRFSSLAQPSEEAECDSQLVEFVKVFEGPAAGVQQPHFMAQGVPGQTEAVFGVGHGPNAAPGQSDVTWGR